MPSRPVLPVCDSHGIIHLHPRAGRGLQGCTELPHFPPKPTGAGAEFSSSCAQKGAKPALCTEVDCAGPHGRKGAQSETIYLHDLMQTGENNNNKRKTLKTENRKLLIGSMGAIQVPKYKHRASFSMLEATWDIHTGLADLTLDLWKTCSLLEQQLGARCDTLRHQNGTRHICLGSWIPPSASRLLMNKPLFHCLGLKSQVLEVLSLGLSSVW